MSREARRERSQGPARLAKSRLFEAPFLQSLHRERRRDPDRPFAPCKQADEGGTAPCRHGNKVSGQWGKIPARILSLLSWVKFCLTNRRNNNPKKGGNPLHWGKIMRPPLSKQVPGWKTPLLEDRPLPPAVAPPAFWDLHKNNRHGQNGKSEFGIFHPGDIPLGCKTEKTCLALLKGKGKKSCYGGGGGGGGGRSPGRICWDQDQERFLPGAAAKARPGEGEARRGNPGLATFSNNTKKKERRVAAPRSLLPRLGACCAEQILAIHSSPSPPPRFHPPECLCWKGGVGAGGCYGVPSSSSRLESPPPPPLSFCYKFTNSPAVTWPQTEQWPSGSGPCLGEEPALPSEGQGAEPPSPREYLHRGSRRFREAPSQPRVPAGDPLPTLGPADFHLAPPCGEGTVQRPTARGIWLEFLATLIKTGLFLRAQEWAQGEGSPHPPVLLEEDLRKQGLEGMPGPLQKLCFYLGEGNGWLVLLPAIGQGDP
ncbi:uncharacterized protein LOC125430280 isoform X2 [Sphaerodactylus townsendi]|uniref:uncharacterized protein LOC125430280 isoform X2 n=1 Tax=Sphaerodactylus townsendi TaxID=933632 RepID=UPI0020274AF3|nr:uncharacterized protein LOC125430280 isoform X2 [Sphaerodactylus townsendi]